MIEQIVLIVEDNPANLKLTKFCLIKHGVSVLEATSAAAALQILQTTIPDLILMDVQLPDMDGLELTRKLKANPVTQHITIIAVTAYAMAEDKQRALAAGCDGYISKPFDISTLHLKVTDYINQKKK